jgi:hypothetical protein
MLSLLCGRCASACAPAFVANSGGRGGQCRKPEGDHPPGGRERAWRAAGERSCRDGRPGLTDRTMGRPVFGVAGERGPRAPLPSPKARFSECGRRRRRLCERGGLASRESCPGALNGSSARSGAKQARSRRAFIKRRRCAEGLWEICLLCCTPPCAIDALPWLKQEQRHEQGS